MSYHAIVTRMFVNPKTGQKFSPGDTITDPELAHEMLTGINAGKVVRVPAPPAEAEKPEAEADEAEEPAPEAEHE